MALINNLNHSNNEPNVRTSVSAEYCFNNSYFEVRTYKANDVTMSGGAKQIIQLDKETATQMVSLLNQFINQG